MIRTKVYEPCTYCDGDGKYVVYERSITGETVITGEKTCVSCDGTGKGSIKEIQETWEEKEDS